MTWKQTKVNIKREKLEGHYYNVGKTENGEQVYTSKWSKNNKIEDSEKDFDENYILVHEISAKINLSVEGDDYPYYIDVDLLIISKYDVEYWNENSELILDKVSEIFGGTFDYENHYIGLQERNVYSYEKDTVPNLEYGSGFVTRYSLWKLKKEGVKAFSQESFEVDLSDV